MNCPNCGNQVQEGMNNCPYCGSVLNNNNAGVNQGAYQQPQQQMYQQPMGMGPRPMIKKRDIVITILLSIVTCGLYGIYWLVCMTDESNSLSNTKTASGGLTILYIILTCGIYSLYWNYMMGKKMHEAGQKYSVPIADNSILYLVLSIFGLQIVNEVLIQLDLNKFANQ